MFTGIVEEIGIVENIEHKTNLSLLRIKADKVIPGTKLGESICVDGVCLTVTSKTSKTLTFDIMKESLRLTTLGKLQMKSNVNLERALKAGDRLGGHFVTGHVDCVGRIVQKAVQANYLKLTVRIPKSFLSHIVSKGSVTVNGVSLTVSKVKKDSFDVCLIPFTDKNTNLSALAKGDPVNIETDILAKYIYPGFASPRGRAKSARRAD